MRVTAINISAIRRKIIVESFDCGLRCDRLPSSVSVPGLMQWVQTAPIGRPFLRGAFMTPDTKTQAADTLFAGAGAIRARCRGIAWNDTPLGPVEHWPMSLRAAVRLCLDTRTAMAVWVGADFTLVYNEAYASVLGARHPWALGRPAREVWPEVWDALEPEFRLAFERGTPTRHEEARFRLQRGETAEDAYFAYSLTPIREEDGSIVGLSNVLEETTAYVRARAQREAFLAFALASARTGAWELLEDGSTSQRNREHDRIFGYSEPLERWSYEDFLGHVVAEDRESVDRQFRHAVEIRGIWSFECRIRRHDGEIRWIAAIGRHLDGDGPRLAGIVQDITERRNAEDLLRRSDARQAFLLQLGDALRPLADPVEIQGAAARLLRAYLQASRVHYGEVEPDGEHVVVARDHAHGVPDRAGRYALADFPGFTGESGTARSFVLNDAATDTRLSPDEKQRLSSLPVQAAVVVPLVKEHRLAALLAVHQERARNWSPGEIEVIEEIAERTWDAVARARSEQALRASEARFRQTLESMREGCAILGFDWTYHFVNQTIAEQARSTPEDMLGRRLHEVVPGIESTPFFEAYRRCMEERTRQQVESGFTFADGSSGWFEAVAEPVPEGIFVRSQDITARKRDEQMMRASRAFIDEQRARLQAIVDTIPVGLFVAESDGRVVLTNDEAIRVWAGAVPLERIEDYQEYVAYWPGTGKRLGAEEWPATRALVDGIETRELVIDIERFDGTRGTLVVSAAPIRDAEQRTTGAVVVMQDITELRDTQKRLEEADRRKDHFLAVLSHELRNPLAPIRNGLYILDRVPAGGEQAQRARDVIARQVDQLSHLVDDLLDLTRISRDKVQLQRRRVELNALVRGTVDDHLPRFQASRIEMALEPAPHPIYIDADSNRIAQVLSNLLHNAAKFTPPGGRVTVTTATDAAERFAILRVADTGRGMAAELIAKVFEPFTQADTTLDRSEGGLGLGLALVKGLVEQHGGSIEARSDGLGHGATFTLRLPLDGSPRLAEPDAAPAVAGVQRRVLVIEDNADAAESLRQVLALDGHEVAVAHTGPDGLEIAHRFHPDIVLCDIGLPGMDGYAVARAFRADVALQHTHLVALSGYALPEDLRRADEAGFDRHLTKPASRDALEQVLREVG
jgi:PAS domain S-box-containing protein